MLFPALGLVAPVSSDNPVLNKHLPSYATNLKIRPMFVHLQHDQRNCNDILNETGTRCGEAKTQL